MAVPIGRDQLTVDDDLGQYGKIRRNSGNHPIGSLPRCDSKLSDSPSLTAGTR